MLKNRLIQHNVQVLIKELLRLYTLLSQESVYQKLGQSDNYILNDYRVTTLCLNQQKKTHGWTYPNYRKAYKNFNGKYGINK